MRIMEECDVCDGTGQDDSDLLSPPRVYRCKFCVNGLIPSGIKVIGWFNPDNRQFCYADEKEHLPIPYQGYTQPVIALNPGTYEFEVIR